MSGRLTRHAYEQLIAEDIAFVLEHAPVTLERTHVVEVLRASIAHEYGKRPEPSSTTVCAHCGHDNGRHPRWCPRTDAAEASSSSGGLTWTHSREQ